MSSPWGSSTECLKTVIDWSLHQLLAPSISLREQIDFTHRTPTHSHSSRARECKQLLVTCRYNKVSLQSALNESDKDPAMF